MAAKVSPNLDIIAEAKKSHQTNYNSPERTNVPAEEILLLHAEVPTGLTPILNHLEVINTPQSARKGPDLKIDTASAKRKESVNNIGISDANMLNSRKSFISNTSPENGTNHRKSRRRTSLVDIINNASIRLNNKGSLNFIKNSTDPNDTEINTEKIGYKRPTMTRGWFTFDDPKVEHAFRKHIRVYIAPQIKIGVLTMMVYNILLCFMEYFSGYSEGAKLWFLGIRAVMVGLMGGFLSTTQLVHFSRYRNASCVVLYLTIGILNIVLYAIGAKLGPVGSNDVQLYGFFRGQWSLLSMLLYVTFTFNMSGLPTLTCIVLTTFFILFAMIVLLAAFWNHRDEFFGWEVLLLPSLIGMCGLSKFKLEKHMRKDYVLCCDIAHDRHKRDSVLNSMLPPRVSRMLKGGHRAEDVAESFDSVAILFAYITGFKELVVKMNQDELVAFVNSFFTIFDYGTDFHNVYKLEAIEASYLCCAGAPDTEEKGGAHADRIVEMAITILAIAYHTKLPLPNDSDTKDAGDPGTCPEMKIGIHMGPVVAGVAGNKAPSYHCFGDTINTASRMGSTGAKGRIQLSTDAYKALTLRYKLKCTPRGDVNIKGKGIMSTYWIDCTEEELRRRYAEIRHYRASVGSYRTDLDFPNSNKLSEKADGSNENGTVEVVVDNVRVENLRFKLIKGKHDILSKHLLLEKLESEYRVAHNSTNIYYLQRILILMMIVTSGSIYLGLFEPYVNIPQRRMKQWLALRLLAIFVAACMLYATTLPGYLKNVQARTALLLGIYVSLIETDMVFAKKHHLCATTMFMIITVSLLINLRFSYVLAVNSCCVGLYSILFFINNYDHHFDFIMGSLVYVFVTAFVGTWACYKREHEFRYDFLHQLMLTENKACSELLLKNMLPNLCHVQSLLAEEPVVDHLPDVTIMFSDLKGYTEWCAEQAPMNVYKVLNKVYTAFDKHIEPSGVYKLDTIGDAFVVVAGLDGYKSKDDHVMAMVLFAFRILFELERIKAIDGLKFEMRIGIHTGPAIGSVIGEKKPRYLLWGETPLIANELESKGVPGKVVISSTAFKRLSKAKLEDKGLTWKPLHIGTGEKATVQSYVLGMESITAYTQLASEIEAEKNITENEGGSTSPMKRKSLNALAKLKSALLLAKIGAGSNKSDDPGSSSGPQISNNNSPKSFIKSSMFLGIDSSDSDTEERSGRTTFRSIFPPGRKTSKDQ